jgi:hypothetical protein
MSGYDDMTWEQLVQEREALLSGERWPGPDDDAYLGLVEDVMFRVDEERFMRLMEWEETRGV